MTQMDSIGPLDEFTPVDFDCARCEAVPGKPCKVVEGANAGRLFAATQWHTDRMRKAQARGWKTPGQRRDDERLAQSREADKQLHDAKRTRMSREQKVEQILWGLQFARKIGIDQDVIDRNIAELLIDVEEELHLF